MKLQLLLIIRNSSSNSSITRNGKIHLTSLKMNNIPINTEDLNGKYCVIFETYEEELHEK